MKLTNKQVAERFAELYTSGESDNMFIEGDKIYSYGHHFIIARRINSCKYEFTTDKYSTTTGKHKSLVLKALQDANVEIIFKSLNR